ncbi:MAG TPA: hypothetical protein DCW90_18780 [Lachnospiraceae bacterium]|nr:hypothetical protein [Lachnospiraceae bacterium]
MTKREVQKLLAKLTGLKTSEFVRVCTYKNTVNNRHYETIFIKETGKEMDVEYPAHLRFR